MAKLNWRAKIGVVFVLLSLAIYVIHYLIFHDAYHIFYYGIMDISFVFVQVLMVTLIIDQLLSGREKQVRLEKLNMVIGVFFSEVGLKMLGIFSSLDTEVEKVREHLIVRGNWDGGTFASVSAELKKYKCSIDIGRADIGSLREYVTSKRDFLTRLLENPVLLEHETFTELLRAAFHLFEELDFRTNIASLPQADIGHIRTDMERMYGLLISEWLDYMKYLKENYPYLFSLAIRTNPFDSKASPIVD